MTRLTRWLGAVPTLYLALTAMPVIFAISRLLIAVDKRCFDYHVGTREGWFVERATFFLLLAASALALPAAVQRRRERSTALFGRAVSLNALFFLGLSVMLFFGAGEEVSWGQRAFDIAVPAWIEEPSNQDELNLHNVIEGISDFSTSKATELLAFGFGVIGPLAARKGRVPLPSLYLVPGFLLSGLLMQGRFAEFEKETGELAISAGLTLYLLIEWQQRTGSLGKVTPRGLAVWSVCSLLFVPLMTLLLIRACP